MQFCPKLKKSFGVSYWQKLETPKKNSTFGQNHIYNSVPGNCCSCVFCGDISTEKRHTNRHTHTHTHNINKTHNTHTHTHTHTDTDTDTIHNTHTIAPCWSASRSVRRARTGTRLPWLNRKWLSAAAELS